MELEITFANPAQRSFYYSNARNQCFSGGFNNGKTYAGCLKAFTLLSTFPKYRMCIARQTFADLKITTIQTFFKICPRELVARYNEQDGFLELLNGSVVYFKHLGHRRIVVCTWYTISTICTWHLYSYAPVSQIVKYAIRCGMRCQYRCM